MSEADRVFPAPNGRGPRALTSEKRLILSAPRRSGPGAGKSRVVEVVHVRRDRARQVEDHSPPAPWKLATETSPEASQAVQAQPLPLLDTEPVTPEPAPPVVHVMPMWQPSPLQPAPLEAELDEGSAGTVVTGQGRPRVPKGPTLKVAVRRFADPFTDEGGANCLGCGYLVQPAREKRGLLTCATCG